MTDQVHSPYMFRKVDGAWQRRHRDGGHWFTLEIKRVQPTKIQKRPGNQRSNLKYGTAYNEWRWV